MYSFQKRTEPRKRRGPVKEGWHRARIHEIAIRNDSKGGYRQHLEVDCEIIKEEKYRNILVPAFFNYDKNGEPDPRLIDLGEAAGMVGDYEDMSDVIRALIGQELMVYTVHRYREKRRLEKVHDFRRVDEGDEVEEVQNEDSDVKNGVTETI
jgi:Arc/MetJ-type ribon-helix-helix transcriptional regulator